MKFLFSLILALLITLPNCGVVFAGGLDTMIEHTSDMEDSMLMHSDITQISLESNSISFPDYNCCPNAHKNALEKDVISTYSIKVTPKVIYVSSFSIQNVFRENIHDTVTIPYRPHAPPDPSQYCSLIGSSVKNLE